MPWIGVDLDRTLAVYPPPPGEEIGPPVPAMLERVKRWLAEGKDVRIFTARACLGELACENVAVWCLKHLGRVLPVTNAKDFELIEFFDDLAVQIEPNTGRIIGQSLHT